MNEGPKDKAEKLTARIWSEIIDVLDRYQSDKKMDRAQNKIRRLLEREVFRDDCEKSAV